MVHSKDFKFWGEEIAIIINKTIILLNNEDNSKLRISAFLLLGILYQNIRSRYFADMKHYLRDFVVSDVSSITNFGILHDYYTAAYLFLWHFCETDSDLVEIRDLLIDATEQKMDDFSKDFSKIVKPTRCSVSPTLKKKICFLSHITSSLHSSYANTRSFYSFLKGLHSSSSDQFDFYWYTLEMATDETVEELRSSRYRGQTIWWNHQHKGKNGSLT